MVRSLGIDIGLTGAAANVETAAHRSVKLIAVLDLPTLGEGRAKSLDVEKYAAWVRRQNPLPERAVLENVFLRPPFDATSGSKFMKMAGALAAATIVLGIPVFLVEPKVWKTRFGLSGKEAGSFGERLACELAQKIFKSDAVLFSKISEHHDRAEAALMGAFAGDQILSSYLKPYPG